MAVRAVRGATHLSADDADEMREAVVELVTAMLERNALGTDDLISVLFTATPDLVSAFPAGAARALDIGDVPLICAQEIDVDRRDAAGRAGHGPRRVRPAARRGHARVPARRRGPAHGPGPVSGLPEPVLIVGTGLIGTSLALSLRRRGVVVWLADRDPDAVAVAVARGAGEPLPGRCGSGGESGRTGARAGGGGRSAGGDRRRRRRRAAAVPRGRRHRCRLGEGADPPGTGRCRGGCLPVRRGPSDGRARGVRTGRCPCGPHRRPAVGDHPAPRRGRGRPSTPSRSWPWPPVRCPS